jgi:hypothetical protein
MPLVVCTSHNGVDGEFCPSIGLPDYVIHEAEMPSPYGTACGVGAVAGPRANGEERF